MAETREDAPVEVATTNCVEVGGGPAGIMLAYLLARAGVPVTLREFTAFAPKLEAARAQDRGVLIDALLTAVAYHRVGNRPGRWEPRARKRRPKPGTA
jgi:glycine/D-amino acid oxidase-like deaminating enzyme